MRYFVTGGTGFIGGEVIRQLRARGDDVVALVRDPARVGALRSLGVELAPGDVGDRESLSSGMAGADGVFHIAGWYHVGDPDRAAAWAVNVEGTRNVLEVMGHVGVGKGVYTSTLAVNSDTHGVEVDETYHFVGRHLSTYDSTKAEAHRIAMNHAAAGLPLVIVQPGMVYGPGDTSALRASLRNLLAGRLPVVPDRAAFSWAHIEDVAAAHLAAMDRGRVGQNYFICGPTHRLAEVMSIAARVSGVREPRAVPATLLGVAAPVSGLVGRVLRLPDAYTPEGLRVLGATYIGRNDLARSELGYLPRPLAEGWVPTVRHEMGLPD